MSITISGDGSITGLVSGGLPDGSVTAADLASGAITSGALPSGSVLQVVSASTDSHLTYTVNQYITPLAVSITPTSTSSKIIISLNFGFIGADTNADLGINIRRDGTQILKGQSATYNNGTFMPSMNTDSTHGNAASFSIVDSPSTTSSVAYTFQAVPNGVRTMYINRRGADASYTGVSSVILMEIAG